MASKEAITNILKYHKTKKAFEPHFFGGKTTENAKTISSSFNNYCKLDTIDGQENNADV